MLGPIRFRCVGVWISPELPCKYIHNWIYEYSITIWAVPEMTWVLLKSEKCLCLLLCSIYSAPSIVVYTLRQFALLAVTAHLLLFACFEEFCLFVFGATAASPPPPPQWARASSFKRFLDHTLRRTTMGRTPLDEWSARRRNLYLTTYNIHDRHPWPRWDSNPQAQP